MASEKGLAIASAHSDCASSSYESNPGDTEKNDPLDGLRRILADQSHLFACGGDIPICDPKVPPKLGNQTKLPLLPSERRESHPITIRWDLDGTADNQDGLCAKLTLPLTQGAEAGLDRLLQHSRPATFGRGGQDIYDESYRKAFQMDPAAFCTTFDPYSVGIIDAVAQALLPSVFDSTTHRSVRAELYKLNVSWISFRWATQIYLSVSVLAGFVINILNKGILRTFWNV